MNAFLEEIWNQIQELFDPQLLGSRMAEITINVIVASFAVGAFYLLWLLVSRAMQYVMRRSRMDKTTQAFVRTIVKFTILLGAIFNGLNILGVDTAGLLTSLGIVGITIGFAARDAFSNLISGILIYLDRPFVIGDLVEVGEFYGRVDQIKLRSTRIITPDGKMLAVPNTEIINKIVTSYTNFPHLRLDIGVTIGVHEDIGKAREALLQVVREGEGYMLEPAPRVVVRQLNDYNVALELQVWIHDERRHVEKETELREKVFAAMNAALIEMPFETLEIRTRSLAPLEAAA